MSDTRQVLNFMPARGGLATAGKRSTIDEGQLWVAENAYPDLDGMILSRPGLVQWGQVLTKPAADSVNAFHELFQNLDSWEVVSADTANSAIVSLGKVTISMASTSASTVQLSRLSSSTSTEDDYSLKFVARLTNPDGADTTGGQLLIRVSGDAGTTVHEIVIDADDIRITGITGAVYTPEYKLDLGGPHTYEFYYDSTANTMSIAFDGVLGTAFSMASATDTGFFASTATCETVQFRATLGAGDDAWSVTLTDIQYTDKVYDADDLPFTAMPLVDVAQYDRLLEGGLVKRSFLAATGELLYADIGKVGSWQPLMHVLPGRTFMLPFQTKLLLFDDNGQNTARLFEWDGVAQPAQINDAPPVRFGAVHRTRLWAAGDRNFPLRAYFTASRRSHVWFAPEYDGDETYDEVMNAGYIVIPAETGEEITGLYGEYFGSLVVQTSKGIWRVTGSSPASFRVENISKLVGGAAPSGMVQLGNDLFGVGKSGVYTAQSVATTGDFQTALPSGAIADKWSSLPSIASRVDRNQLYHSHFVALPSLNIAVLGMRSQGSLTMDQTLVYSPTLQQWYGPWSNNATCFAQVEIGAPEVEVLLEGHYDGRVALTGLSESTDMGTPYTFTLASPMYSGRSLDPLITSNRKTWRVLRLFLLPRVDQTFTISWWTDTDLPQTETRSQNPDREPGLSDEFVLDVDRLASAETVVASDITLNAKGSHLWWQITSDYPIAYQGCQLEFMPGD